MYIVNTLKTHTFTSIFLTIALATSNDQFEVREKMNIATQYKWSQTFANDCTIKFVYLSWLSNWCFILIFLIPFFSHLKAGLSFWFNDFSSDLSLRPAKIRVVLIILQTRLVFYLPHATSFYLSDRASIGRKKRGKESILSLFDSPSYLFLPTRPRLHAFDLKDGLTFGRTVLRVALQPRRWLTFVTRTHVYVRVYVYGAQLNLLHRDVGGSCRVPIAQCEITLLLRPSLEPKTVFASF